MVINSEADIDVILIMIAQIINIAFSERVLLFCGDWHISCGDLISGNNILIW